jgi:hypothetical protein
MKSNKKTPVKYGLYAKKDFHIFKAGELIKTKVTNDPDSLIDGTLYNYMTTFFAAIQ